MTASWLGLAQAQIAIGTDPNVTLASLERALRLGEQQASVRFAAGALYDRLGLHDEADAALASTIVTYPSLAADPVWKEVDFAARFPGIVEAAMAAAPQKAWEVALMTGDPGWAHELAAAGPAHAGLFIDAWAGDADSLATIYELADASPGSPTLLSGASRLAARADDTDQADRYQRLAVFLNTEGGELSGTEIRVDADGWLDTVPAGTRTSFAGQYLYRRPLSPDLLPPGLPRIIHAPRDEEPDQTALDGPRRR